MMVSVTLFAAPRTMEQAAEIAAQFTNQQPQLRMMHKAPRKAANMRLAHKALQNNSEEAAFYVFNQEGNNGFVIVSADDRTAEEVLGYTENGAFDADHINPNLQWWLNRYAEEITVLQTMDDSEFINEPVARKAAQVTAIAPLLVNQNGVEITWYQETPYNNLCPIDQLDNTRSLTGCVATAASMVMCKWRHPAQGTGSSSYTWFDCTSGFDYNYNCIGDGVYVPLSANYGETTYDWDNMLPSYEGRSSTAAQKTAVATLMYHAGVSCEMLYGGQEAGGSGAMTDYMAYGLKTYFGYEFEKFITMYSRSVYGGAHEGVPAEFSVTKDQFKAYFNADLEAGRPIIMGGEGDGGHEFVCDGRDANNKFHINFGWEGSGNGYYTLSALGPSGAQFSNNLDAIIGLRPATTPVEPFNVTWMANGTQFTTTTSTGKVVLPANDPVDCSENRVFTGWTATADYSSATTAPTYVKAGDAVQEGAIFYAVYADVTGEGGGSSFDGNTSGAYKIYADVNGTKYYATSVSNSKLQSTTDEAGATTFTFTAVNGGFTISNGSKYIKHSSGTNISAVNDPYIWTITAGEYGTWRVNSQTENRALIFRASTYNVFGGYATSNVNGTEYFDLEIGDSSSASYSNYSTVCGGGSALENTVVTPKAVKVIENGQLIIIRENEKYSIFGQKIQ